MSRSRAEKSCRAGSVGGTRRDRRGQGFFRALTDKQEAWARDNGFDEIIVKTKNRFYDMRGTHGHLKFNVIEFEPHQRNDWEVKVYLGKLLGVEVFDAHCSQRSVVPTP